MNIKTPKHLADYQRLDVFFGNIWKDTFGLNTFGQEEKYQQGYVYFFEANGNIIAAIAFAQQDGHWKIRRIATEKSYQNRGLGRQLLEKTFDFLQAHSVSEIFLQGEITKLDFYKKFGFEVTGEKVPVGTTYSVTMRKTLGPEKSH